LKLLINKVNRTCNELS